jgi:RHS repeat-associated protein
LNSSQTHDGCHSRGQESSIVRDADGRRKTISFPNCVSVAYTYDADSQVKTIAHSGTGAGSIGNLVYGYNANGRVISLDGSLASTLIPDPMTATYDNSNQVATWNSVSATSDSRGNLTYDPSNAGTYTWNERGQLDSAGIGVGTTTFTYDALGRRRSLTINGGTATQFAYDGLNVARKISGATTFDMLAGIDLDDWFMATQNGTNPLTSTFVKDASNSTVVLENPPTQPGGPRFTYEPFGNTNIGLGEIPGDPIAFTGRELDDTWLYYMRNRYYNPVLQRFLSPDPIGYAGGSINLYAYVNNDPLNAIDPQGLSGGSTGSGGGGGWPPDPSPNPCPGCFVYGLNVVSWGQGFGGSPQGDIIRIQNKTLPTPAPTRTPMDWNHLTDEQKRAVYYFFRACAEPFRRGRDNPLRSGRSCLRRRRDQDLRRAVPML